MSAPGGSRVPKARRRAIDRRPTLEQFDRLGQRKEAEMSPPDACGQGFSLAGYRVGLNPYPQGIASEEAEA